jgi:hypothetical protein
VVGPTTSTERIWLFGGVHHTHTARLQSVLSLQLATGKWKEEGVRLKCGRAWAAACPIQHQIFVAGGDTPEAAQSLEVYDSRTKRLVQFEACFYSPPRLRATIVRFFFRAASLHLMPSSFCALTGGCGRQVDCDGWLPVRCCDSLHVGDRLGPGHKSSHRSPSDPQPHSRVRSSFGRFLRYPIK